MKTAKILSLLLCALFVASQPVLAQNGEDTRNKAVMTTDDGERLLNTDEISIIRFDGPKVTVVQPWGATVFDRTLRSLTFMRPLPGMLRLTVTSTLNGDDGVTRGLDINAGGQLAASWKTGDQVYVYADATTTTPIGTLTPETTDAKTSKLTGDVTATGLTNGQTLFLSTKPRNHSFATQTNSLDDLFYYKAEATVTITGGNASIADASFSMAQSVTCFTLQDGSSDAVNATQLVITGGTEDITVTSTATNVFYVAMPAKTSTAYSFTATTSDSREWTGTKTVALVNGKYYRTTVTLTKTKLTVTDPSSTMTTAVEAKKNGTANQSYTGSALELVTAGVSSAGTLRYQATTTNTKPSKTEGTWTTTVPTATDADTYYVWYYAEGNDDYNATDVCTTPVTVTIDPAAASTTLTTTPAANTGGGGLTYTGDALDLITAGASADGTLMYKVTTSNTAPLKTDAGWASTVPTATDAGTYYVWYYVDGDGNHSDSDVFGTSIEVTIANATMTGITATAYNAAYDGTAHGITVNGVPEGAIVTYSTDGENYQAANYTYTDVTTAQTVHYKVSKANYDDFAGSSTVTINKKTVTVSGITAANKTYDGTATATLNYSNATFDGIIAGDELTITAATYYFTDVNVGTERDVALEGLTLGGTSVDNYQLATSGNQDIAKANISKAMLTATADNASRAYGADNPLFTVIVTGFVNGETASTAADYVYPIASTTATPESAVGTYDITPSGGSATNYDFTYTAGTLTVTNATLSVTANDYSGVYDGAAHGITVTCEGATIMYGESEGTYDQTASPTQTNAGTKTVYYQVTKDNYTTVTGSKTVTIGQLEAALSWSNTSFTYDGSSHVPTATVSNLITGDACTVTVTGAQTAASSDPYTATATALSNSNYKLPATVTQTFTIAKVAATLTCSTTALSFTASQNTNATVTKTGVSCTGGTINVSSGNTSNCTVTYSDGTITVTRATTAAFTNTVITVSVTPDDNHIAPSSVTFNVSAVAYDPGVALASSSAGYIVSSNGKAYPVSYKSSWNSSWGTKAGVVVYKSGSSGFVVSLYNCGGSASSDGTTYTWANRTGGLSSVTSVSGRTWIVGSEDQYTTALTSQWSTAMGYITSAGGRTLVSLDYWSCTEDGSNFGRCFYNGGWFSGSKSFKYYVRPCFAF